VTAGIEAITLTLSPRWERVRVRGSRTGILPVLLATKKFVKGPPLIDFDSL